MKRKSKFLIFTILFVLITANLFAEKWVGQANTYQLKPGSRMADGTPFDKNKVAAACNCFKIGAKVKVTNTKTGKSADVTITDRVNNESNYFILLTPKAASAIDAEWESCIVIVQANFGDINSEDVFKVNGLVPENQLDPDSLKEFPDINWPDEEPVEEEEDEEEEEIPDFVKELLEEEEDDFEDIPFDIEEDEEEYEEESQAEEEPTEYEEPETETPEPAEEKISDEPKEPIQSVPVMEEEAEIVKEEPVIEEEPEPVYPSEEVIPTPEYRCSTDVMEDSRMNPVRPDIQNETKPAEVQKTTFSDEDYAKIDKEYPAEDSVLKPVWSKWKINADEIFGENYIARPNEDSTADVNTEYPLLSEDDDIVEVILSNPAEEYEDMPEMTDDIISEDDDTEVIICYPAEEITLIPDMTDDILSDDGEEAEVILKRPSEEDALTPDATDDIISEDDIDLPECDVEAIPEATDDLISEDDNNLANADKPVEERERIPAVSDILLSEDETDDTTVSMLLPPEDETTDIMTEEPVISDEDYADIVTEDETEDEPDMTPIEVEEDEAEVTATPVPAEDESSDIIPDEEEITVEEDEAFIEGEPTEDEETYLAENEITIVEDEAFIESEPTETTDDTSPAEEETTVEEDEAVIEEIVEDEETFEDTEEPADDLDWVTSLEPNKIYVRFMTSFDKAEAQRMARNFKSIIGNITVYKTDDKFILLCGPYDSDSDEAFRALSDLKSMGFADAYLMSE